MNVRMMMLALVVFATSGCAMWRGHAPLECEKIQSPKKGPGIQEQLTAKRCEPERTYSAKELVMAGMAEPDSMIVRLPIFRVLGDGTAFLKLFAGPYGMKDAEWIADDLYLIPLDSDGSREAQAERVQDAVTLMNLLSEIRLQPGGIPERLRGVLTQDILNSFLFPVSNPIGADATRPLAAIPPDFFKDAGAELNLVIHAMATPPPQDPEYGKQCGLRAIKAEKAWYDNGADASKVNIAIVDTGLVEDHVDLVGNAEPATSADVDRNGHGTHVAGIIGAISDDKTGVVGVTWKTSIKSYKFLDGAGRGTLDDALKQIKNALTASPPPHIVVLPWGTGVVASPALRETLKKATSVLFVAAAGNSGQDACKFPVYPAAYALDNVISVMATTCDDVRAPFSNYGANVDLAAPGEGVSSTLRIYSTDLTGWGNLAGTSMSAAFVAGAAALVLQPSIATQPYTPKQVKCWLRRSVTELGLENATKGRLDLEEAVQPLNKSTCEP